MSILTAARAAADRGWHVMPLHHMTSEGACSCPLGADCKSAAKHPLRARWQDSPDLPAADITRIFSTHPTPNYGIRTGSGLLVVDEDTDKGADILDLVADLEDGDVLLETYTVRTGSGGRHFYLSLPEGEVLGNSQSKLGPGIDTRGDGGFVVGPGSISTKGPYTEHVPGDVLPAPESLLRRLRTKVKADAPTHVAPLAPSELNPARRTYVRRGVEAELERLDAMANAAVSGDWASSYRGESWDGACYAVACNLVELANTNAGYTLDQLHQAFLEHAPTDVSFVVGNHEEKWRSALTKVGANARDLTRVGLHSGTVAADVIEASDDPAPDGARTVETEHADPDRISVCLGDRDDSELFAEIVAAMLAYDEANPLIFRSGDELVRLDVRTWRLVPLTVPSLRLEVASRVAFYVWREVKGKAKTKGEDEKEWTAVPAALPKHVLEMLLASPPLDFPECAAVSHTGFFTPAGQWWDRRGYCAEASTYCTGIVASDPIPAQPTGTDVQVALARLAEPLAGFPFANQSSRAHALALLLLPFARSMVTGPTPLTLIEASTAGTGKTKLAETLLHPSCGDIAVNDTPSRKDEVVKTVFSALRMSPRALVLDNIPEETTFGAGELASMLTSYPHHSARVLGTSTLATVSTTNAWVATGNNPQYTNELARRIVTIELNAGDNVLDREFDIDDLTSWMHDHRPAMIAAAATIIRAWLGAGRPAYTGRRLASFESWSSVLGGILAHAGVSGFMVNQRDVASRNDVQSLALVAFLEGWSKMTNKAGEIDVRRTTADLIEMMDDLDIEFPAVRGGTPQARKASLGRHIQRTMVGKSLPGGYTVQEHRSAGQRGYWLIRESNVTELRPSSTGS